MLIPLFPSPVDEGEVPDILEPHSPALQESLLARYASSLESLGVWTTVTDSRGNFEVDVAAHKVSADILTPGWRIVGAAGRHNVAEPLDLTVTGVPVFRFFDAEAAAIRRRYKRKGNSKPPLEELAKKQSDEERQLEASLRKELSQHPRRRGR